MDAGAAFWEERGEGAAATLGKFANDWNSMRKTVQLPTSGMTLPTGLDSPVEEIIPDLPTLLNQRPIKLQIIGHHSLITEPLHCMLTNLFTVQREGAWDQFMHGLN